MRAFTITRSVSAARDCAWNRRNNRTSASGLSSFRLSSRSERRRSVHPQHPRLTASGIAPAVRGCALEVEAVAGLQAILITFERYVQLAPEYKKKFFALVGVGITTAGMGRDAKQVRLHNRVSPGEQLHTHAGARLEDLAALRPDQSR